jgi:hypothetical protein
VRNLLRRSKDATAAFAARQAVNSKLRGIGEMTGLSIDSKNGKIHALLELAGEIEPIKIEITKYRLIQEKSGARLTIEEATASREWLATALRQFVVGRTFPLPARVAGLLKFLE